jgi:hypothetical protein
MIFYRTAVDVTVRDRSTWCISLGTPALCELCVFLADANKWAVIVARFDQSVKVLPGGLPIKLHDKPSRQRGWGMTKRRAAKDGASG